MKPIGTLDEIMISVIDLRKMKDFYERIVGFDPVFYHAGRMAGLDGGGVMLVLKVSKRTTSGVGIGLSCRDVEGVIRRLVENGVRITQPLHKGHWGSAVVGFNDPEGNIVYLEGPPAKKVHRHRRVRA